ncbi:MAG: flagellar biogenesis protein FliO [Planctomycetota bacterium]|jgi:flagellar biogenesis protein FliO
MLNLILLPALAIETVPALGASNGPDLTWLMTTSAVLILTIGAVAYGFRRLVVGGIKGRASKRELRVLDVLPLGGKRQLAVVRCYDRTFALGLGEKSVELVAELDTAAVDTDRDKSGDTTPSRAREAFEARLQAAKARLLGTHEMAPQPRPSALEQAATGRPASTGLAPARTDGSTEYVA